MRLTEALMILFQLIKPHGAIYDEAQNFDIDRFRVEIVCPDPNGFYSVHALFVS